MAKEYNFTLLNDRIAYLIKYIAKMGQSDFAKALEVSQTTVSEWVSGKKPVKLEYLELMVSKFDVSYDWLRNNNGLPEAIKVTQKQEKHHELSDREIGRLEGKIEIYEKQLSFFNTHLESVMTQCAQALSHISEKTIGGETKRAREGG